MTNTTTPAIQPAALQGDERQGEASSERLPGATAYPVGRGEHGNPGDLTQLPERRIATNHPDEIRALQLGRFLETLPVRDARPGQMTVWPGARGPSAAWYAELDAYPALFRVEQPTATDYPLGFWCEACERPFDRFVTGISLGDWNQPAIRFFAGKSETFVCPGCHCVALWPVPGSDAS